MNMSTSPQQQDTMQQDSPSRAMLSVLGNTSDSTAEDRESLLWPQTTAGATVRADPALTTSASSAMAASSAHTCVIRGSLLPYLASQSAAAGGGATGSQQPPGHSSVKALTALFESLRHGQEASGSGKSKSSSSSSSSRGPSSSATASKPPGALQVGTMADSYKLASFSSTSSYQCQPSSWLGRPLGDSLQPSDQAVPSAFIKGGPSAASSSHTWPGGAVNRHAPGALAAQLHPGNPISCSSGYAGGGSLLAVPGEVLTGPLSTGDRPLPSSPGSDTRTPPAAAQAPVTAAGSGSHLGPMEGSRLLIWTRPTATDGASLATGRLALTAATTATTTTSSSNSNSSSSAAVVQQGHGGNSSSSSSSSSISVVHVDGTSRSLLVQDPSAHTTPEAALALTDAAGAMAPADSSTAPASNSAVSQQCKRKSGFPAKPCQIALPKGKWCDLTQTYTLPLCSYLAYLSKHCRWDGPLAPSISRCILPKREAAPEKAAPDDKEYFTAVEEQHFLTALVKVACRDVSDDSFNEPVPPLQLDDKDTVERVADVFWPTLKDAAAAPPAAAAPGDSGVERWPLTCPLSNPYVNYMDFKQNCPLLRDFPTQVLKLVCNAEYERWRKLQRGEKVKEPLGLAFQSKAYPFLSINRTVEGSAASANGGLGRLELLVDTAELRKRVWGWSGSAAYAASHKAQQAAATAQRG